MKKKRLLTLAMAALLVVMLVVPTFAASGDVAWKLTADEVKGFIDDGESFGYLKNCGSGSQYATASGNGFIISGDRPRNYDIIEINLTDMFADGVLVAGTEYTLVVEITSKEATTYEIVNAAGYKTLAASDADVTKATLTLKFSDAVAKKGLRPQCVAGPNGQEAGPQPEFTVVSAAIYEGDPPAKSTTTTNPKDGDSMLIFLALGVLALASCATVLVVRKVKA